MTYSPWSDAAQRYPDIHIERTDCRLFRGAWIASERVILLEQSMTRPERSYVLAHELAHIDLGHRDDVPAHVGRRQETEADKLAARRLISFAALLDVARTYDDPATAADALEVPLHLLATRVRALHPAERGVLARAVADTTGAPEFVGGVA